MTWLYVGLGGFAGAVLRYLVGGWIQRAAGQPFPWGTLAVNVSGSLLLGFLMRSGPAVAPRPDWLLALTVGLCGGYTTFSTFSYETVRLARDGAGRGAALYVALSLLLSLAAVLAGAGLAEWWLRARRGA